MFSKSDVNRSEAAVILRARFVHCVGWLFLFPQCSRRALFVARNGFRSNIISKKLALAHSPYLAAAVSVLVGGLHPKADLCRLVGQQRAVARGRDGERERCGVLPEIGREQARPLKINSSSLLATLVEHDWHLRWNPSCTQSARCAVRAGLRTSETGSKRNGL